MFESDRSMGQKPFEDGLEKKKNWIDELAISMSRLGRKIEVCLSGSMCGFNH